jgi:hypothetical protein
MGRLADRRLAGPSLDALLRLGLRAEADALLTQMAEQALEGRDVGAGRAEVREQVGGGWYALGRADRAEPVLEAARALLFGGGLAWPEKLLLAVGYAGALGRAPAKVTQARLEELFQRLGGLRDTYTLNQYFSLAQLDVVEAAVLAAVRGRQRLTGAAACL